jgi:hypothetical protein
LDTDKKLPAMSGRFTAELTKLVDDHGRSCRSCGHPFVDWEVRHEGYDSEGRATILCEECAHLLSEVAQRVVYQAPMYETPSPESKLWRYMDFAKYVSLLSSRALFFARCDTFNDPFEGAKGLLSNKGQWDRHYLDFFRSALSNLPGEDAPRQYSPEELDAAASRLMRQLDEGGRLARSQNFASCWHENDHESEAMWRLYSSYLENAVAIRTSYGSLKAALPSDRSIKIGRIQYIDLGSTYAGVNDAFWRKRKSFAHEREVRALLHDFSGIEGGLLVPCDLDVLIEDVFVSPKSPSWLTPLVNDVNQKYGLHRVISKSELLDTPFF